MNPRFLLLLALPIVAISLFSVGCASKNDHPAPPREKLNRIPHNQPASWEGSAGYGLPSSY